MAKGSTAAINGDRLAASASQENDKRRIEIPQKGDGRPVEFSADSGLKQDPFEIDPAVLRQAAEETPRSQSWSPLQRLSFLTFPLVLTIAALIWLGTFLLIYDMYATSFGQPSFIDYLTIAPYADGLRQVAAVVFTRNTFGLSVLAFVVAFPFIYVWVVWWMLKGGRSLSRLFLYLLHVRSTFSLVTTSGLVFAACWAGVIAYGIVFYLVATKGLTLEPVANYYGNALTAMYQAPFGATNAAGQYVQPARLTVFAALAGLAAAGFLIGFPIAKEVTRRQGQLMGDSRLATLQDAYDFRLREKHGVVLGYKQGMLLRSDSDQHVMVVGSPGQGKSRAFVMPSMMNFAGSMFILDMSGELYEKTSGYMKQKGYEVYLMAPGQHGTHCFNPLDVISKNPHQRITDLQKLAQMLMPERLRSDSNDFWEESARILLVAMLGFVIECPDTRKSLSELYRILNSMSDERTAIAQLLERYGDHLSDQTRMQLTKFIGRHEKLGEGIAAEIGAKFNFLQNELIEAMTSVTTIPITEIRKKKMVIYLQADWNIIQMYERLISIFVQQMADNLVQLGPLRSGEHEVLMMLDEFGNGGRLDTVLTLAPLIRKNGVRFVFILQDGAQLERLYQRPGQKILMGASTIKLYMNFQNVEDAQAVTQIAGFKTGFVAQPAYSYRHGRRDRSGSSAPVRVELLPVHVLMQMKPEEAILQVTGMPIMRIMKLDSGGERQFRAMDKYSAIGKPVIQPRAWTIEDNETYMTRLDAFQGVMTRQMYYPDPEAVHRRVAALKGAGVTNRTLKKTSIRPVDFLWQDIKGERHVFFSSLDELAVRLGLDATRKPGLTVEEASQKRQEASGGRSSIEGRRHDERPGGEAAAKGAGDREARKPKPAVEPDLPDVDVNAMYGRGDDNDDLEVNVEKLSNTAFIPPTHYDRSPSLSRKDAERDDLNVVRSPILQRQEVSSTFGRMNSELNAMFAEFGKADEDVEPLAMNEGIESMVSMAIERLEDEDAKEKMRAYGAVAREPIAEERAGD
ncbi:type IV secretory system conjugative DNA transfer family protein [Aminobacter sp. MET-1]|uniref:type IV secretory system conjugative DNA transfer family protein n=1 Tax=Aminobacter sp. MET-1 TaxID=2951085 RepID=UPI00226AB28C|nr:type IV secretory system conjugative DNA transfer family protein [Aminobacter sp. MET-1]MCX8571137.1 type IV secretory system conjugative DNA transfer family protein [Aminobacter sp. MET-1]MCX8573194.1 type IV secretory system conjugative DNA transfer family protein [Aminobacter sp. MET-1]